MDYLPFHYNSSFHTATQHNFAIALWWADTEAIYHLSLQWKDDIHEGVLIVHHKCARVKQYCSYIISERLSNPLEDLHKYHYIYAIVTQIT